ncbi:MAG: hypothetical protein CMG50_00375 [Candidatus Marinimicrobia bacterium]|nr:hypothetical protein [Candidatus Neomarinimicrobiota bacterium]
MDKKIKLIIDFDSTFVKLETIEILADFALHTKNDKDKILNQIKDITNKAMIGKIPFSRALNQRIKLINPRQEHINKTIIFLKKNISKSFEKNIEFFRKNHENCYIISGGFKEIIMPVIEDFNIKENQIFANTFIHKNNNITINENNPLSKDNGKNIIAKNISGYKIIVGDGYTDYEVKKYKNAKKFVQFVENINRISLNNKADLVCDDFKKIITFIKNDI